jgi:hypothetical protein
MLRRCYAHEQNERHTCYAGCTVCEEWLNYQNFCEDLPKIEGYKEWKNNSNYALDKDGIIKGNKVYRLETCQFIYCGENTRLSNTSRSVYEGIDVFGNKHYFRTQRLFAETHNLSRQGISAVVSQKQKTHRK